MFTHIFVWMTVIGSVALGLWFLYWYLLSPFGPSSRCQLEQIIKPDDKVLLKLMVVDEGMLIPMTRAYLAEHGHRIASYDELKAITEDPYVRKLLPEDARIVGERMLADEKIELWAIDTTSQWSDGATAGRFHKIETPPSMEDCFIAAMPRT